MKKQFIKIFSDIDDPLIREYTHQTIPKEHIDWIYDDLLQPIFGNALINRHIIIQMGEINPSSFQYIIRIDPINKNKTICAILALIPLTSVAAEQMRAGSLLSINLQPEHIAPPHLKHSWAYLAMGLIMSTKKREKAACITYTTKLMKDFSIVLTMPITAQGLRMDQKLGFVPVNSDNLSEIGTLLEWKNMTSIIGIESS